MQQRAAPPAASAVHPNDPTYISLSPAMTVQSSPARREKDSGAFGPIVFGLILAICGEHVLSKILLSVLYNYRWFFTQLLCVLTCLFYGVATFYYQAEISKEMVFRFCNDVTCVFLVVIRLCRVSYFHLSSVPFPKYGFGSWLF
jgi:hypothetical protein